ncbi:MAG: DUF4183 domain-containing protein [Clostridia bacterium]|jgi:hypothetical protein|nr:DUF4183 domain-containing protein [Clostridia bacterium]
MPTQLFRLAITADTTTTTDTNPDVSRYFYDLAAGDRDTATDTLTVLASKFLDDAGIGVPATGLETVAADNGYYSLFINGVLQQTSLFTPSAAQLVVTQVNTIPVSAPITFVVTNFAPTSTSTTTVDT